MLAIINNIAPHVENMARATSSKLLQLFATMSTPTFLLANETNHALLQSLLEAFNAIVEHQYSSELISVWCNVAKDRQKIPTSYLLCSGRSADSRFCGNLLLKVDSRRSSGLISCEKTSRMGPTASQIRWRTTGAQLHDLPVSGLFQKKIALSESATMTTTRTKRREKASAGRSHHCIVLALVPYLR
jgi:hypothetical protein